MATGSLTAHQAAAQITRGGFHWAHVKNEDKALSYAFRDTGGSTGEHDEATFARFEPGQLSGVWLALQLWADVADIRFENASGLGYSNDATMLFANYTSTTDGANGYAPTAAAASMNAAHDSREGDVWINLNSYPVGTDALPGSRQFRTILHEIGHAIGLQHPGDYNADPKVVLTYATDRGYDEDSRQYTVMSYFEATETGASHGGGYIDAPMLHDIAALQLIYGANTLTRELDTVYGSNSTANRDVFNFDINRLPVLAIWDAGGTDTLSVANIGSAAAPLDGQRLNLDQGSFSSTYGWTGSWALLKNNIAIAYGTVIENAIGGPGRDDISGNAARNSLVGGGGNDTISGLAGNDTIDGDAGNDLLVGEEIAFFGPVLTGNDLMRGGPGNDTLLGMAGDDELEGGDGDDLLEGGGGVDTLRGGFGDDIYYVDHPQDRVSEFVANGVFWFGDAGSTDEVRAYASSYTLPSDPDSGLEHLSFVGSGAFTGTGNALANRITGGSAGDALRGEGGDDELLGQGGADVLVGGPGADRLVGGFGNDTYELVDALDTVEEIELGGIDTLRTTEPTYTLPFWVENLIMTAARGTSTGQGNDLANLITVTSPVNGGTLLTGPRFVLHGNGGNDRIVGANSVRGDELFGGAGDDTLEGGVGNDRLVGGPGADRLDGGSLIDTADYGGAPGPVWLSLAGNGSAGEALGDSFVGVEDVIGSPFDDAIAGDGGANRLAGGNGSDTLRGGGGNDKLEGGSGRNDLRGEAGNDSITGGPEFDSFDGGEGNDTLRGNGGQTAMLGGPGDDRLFGSLGSSNAMQGGPGNDSLVGGPFGDSMQDVDGGTDTMRGGDGNDTLIDYAGLNQLYGEHGDDWIVSASTIGSLLDGGEGNDVLFSNGGSNVLLGGPGNDRLENQDGGAVTNHFSGGSGADLFIYRVGVSAPALVNVFDFEDGIDRIGLRFDRFEDLSITDGPLGAVIRHAAAGSPMTLMGVPASLITQADFAPG